jgi:hypothetical protein
MYEMYEMGQIKKFVRPMETCVDRTANFYATN